MRSPTARGRPRSALRMPERWCCTPRTPVTSGPRRCGCMCRRSPLAALVAAVLAAGAAGCGLGPGAGTSNVSVTVTRNFGGRQVGRATEGRVPGSETVMRMLERSFRVRTRYGGGFVQSINGLSGDSARRDWFYYVNGIQAPAGAAATAVHRGDRIWWDLHDWTATETIPAVVGS